MLWCSIQSVPLSQRGATGLERGFAYAVSDSESEEETKRKVVSRKEKYTADLDASMRRLKNDIKINDWKSVVDCKCSYVCIGSLSPMCVCLSGQPLPMSRRR